ncbi:unnamed protein product [Linum tenue]|uniref:Uncharacterized protein n=1 Tax=Linum tenue TaxID=586396 RepID=A0AAV0P7Q4_9ROSI|nr:unnamed protein product [Linum tenue]
MPGTALEMEPVEPQSLKKLSLKSLKRSLDLFSPTHGHVAPPDPESLKVWLTLQVAMEYKGIKSTNDIPKQGNPRGQEPAAPSNALALPGPEGSRDQGKGVSENALVVGPTLQSRGKNEGGLPGKSTTVIPASSSSSRNFSTSAIIERIPSRWPRPEWHAPWKNYRVISGHLGWVRSIAFDPSNTWFCTGSADRTIKVSCPVPISSCAPSVLCHCMILFNLICTLLDSPLYIYVRLNFFLNLALRQQIWDVASGKLKYTLTGHIEQIRGK